MNVNFIYNEDKDIECLLSKGSGSNNSPGEKTKTYEAFLKYTTKINDTEKVKEFVRLFMKENNLNPKEIAVLLQKNWDLVSREFEKRAERVFGISIVDNITGYLTITGRFPYNIQEKYFYVSAKKSNANATAMHELWHFYTWHKFGDYVSKIGSQKYNDIKESLTVLLNIEALDLLRGEIDEGYVQHKKMRDFAVEVWKKTKDINKVWDAMISLI